MQSRGLVATELARFVLCVSTSTEVKVRQNQKSARYRHFDPSSSREKKSLDQVLVPPTPKKPHVC